MSQAVKLTTKSKVLMALAKKVGYNTFSPKQGANRFSVTESRIRSIVSELRQDGYAIYTNKEKRADGSPVSVYKMGRHSTRLLATLRRRNITPKTV